MTKEGQGQSGQGPRPEGNLADYLPSVINWLQGSVNLTRRIKCPFPSVIPYRGYTTRDLWATGPGSLGAEVEAAAPEPKPLPRRPGCGGRRGSRPRESRRGAGARSAGGGQSAAPWGTGSRRTGVLEKSAEGMRLGPQVPFPTGFFPGGFQTLGNNLPSVAPVGPQQQAVARVSLAGLRVSVF